MATHWPQHFQSSQGHSQISYQQYDSQQQQQYGPPHNGSYPVQYQPNPQLAPLQHQPQPDPNACYNCGSADHWAQNCPEPRREFPVGQLNGPNFHRPPKRQKPNAPIITKYPVPPHVQQAHGAAQYYGGQPYSQPTYPIHQVPYGPLTPMSAQSPSQAQWQQGSQYPNYHHTYQQGSYNYNQPVGRYQHSYPTPIAQTPGPFYSSQYSGPQSSPHSQSVGSTFPPSNPQFQQSQGLQMQTSSTSSSSTMVSPFNESLMNRQQESAQVVVNNSSPVVYQPNQPSQTLNVSASQKPDTADTEFGEDDLNMLDIPDLPPSSRHLTDQKIRAGGTSIRLIGRPLPANFIVADAISPIDPPRPENDGLCDSKYQRRGFLKNLLQHVKDSDDWDELSKDPIFLTISDESQAISIQHLKSIYNPRLVDDNSQEAESQVDEAMEETRSPRNGSDTWDVMDSLEHALNAGRRKGNGSTHSTSSTQSKPRKDTEEVLAALGVTGAPKPVRAPARPYPPPSEDQHGQTSPDHLSRSRSRSASRHNSNDSYRRSSQSNSGFPNENQGREGRDASKISDSHGARHTIITHENLSDGHDQHVSAEGSYSQQFKHPPPPPLPIRKPNLTDGIGSSPLSGANHGNHTIPADHNPENTSNYSRYAAEGHSTSPNKVRSERANGRKRDFDRRDSSDECETPGRRQADDVTPKLKRRQPKVAEAYSRRW